MKVTTGLYSVVAASVFATFSACSNAANMPPQEIAGGMAVSTAAGTVAPPPGTVAGTSAPAGAGSFATAGTSATVVAGSFATAGTAAPTAGSSGSAAAGAGGAGPVAGATSGTGGTAAPAGAATFAAVLAIFDDPMVNCGLCHGMPTIGGGLIFKPSDVAGTYAALVGPVSKGTLGSQCVGKTYVVPGMPDASLLYDKLSKATPTCGARMPANGVILTDAQLATVRAWIMAGAKNN